MLTKSVTMSGSQPANWDTTSTEDKIIVSQPASTHDDEGQHSLDFQVDMVCPGTTIPHKIEFEMRRCDFADDYNNYTPTDIMPNLQTQYNIADYTTSFDIELEPFYVVAEDSVCEQYIS